MTNLFFLLLLNFNYPTVRKEGDHKANKSSNHSTGIRQRRYGEVEALICSLDCGSVGGVVSAKSILGARKSAVGEGPGESGSNASLDSGEAVTCEDLEIFVGLKVLDDVFCLGVGDNILQANEIIVLLAVSRTDDGEKVVALGFVSLFMLSDLVLVRSLQGLAFISNA